MLGCVLAGVTCVSRSWFGPGFERADPLADDENTGSDQGSDDTGDAANAVKEAAVTTGLEGLKRVPPEARGDDGGDRPSDESSMRKSIDMAVFLKLSGGQNKNKPRQKTHTRVKRNSRGF